MTEPVPGGSRVNLTLLALLGGIVVLLAIVWFVSGNRSPDQDKLSNPQVEQKAETALEAEIDFGRERQNEQTHLNWAQVERAHRDGKWLAVLVRVLQCGGELGV